MSTGYDPSVEVHYCKENEAGPSNRIVPAPTISISPEIYYANDNPIGYTYNVSLNGYASAIRKDINQNDYGLEPVLDHIGDIRKIFNFNGGNLYIKKEANIIVAKGATIKSISFNPSDNKWVNYSQYTVELEFNEIDFIGCSGNPHIDCDSSIFHQVANAKNVCDNLVNLTSHKIKEFSDKWTFTIDDRIYNEYSDIYNNAFDVNYNISATGKNYYVNGKLIPAYQQAKLFVQERLYNQIVSLINGAIQIENMNMNMDSCEATRDLQEIHNTNTDGGLLSGFDTSKAGSNAVYDVYNETISCDTSESDGSFSLNYKALIKKIKPGLLPQQNAVLHTYTKDTSTDNLASATISVKGNIQGLVRGGFIYYNSNDFELPSNGSFITAKDGSETKYSNALAYYLSDVGNSADLLPSLKNKLNITKSQLLIKGTDGYPSASSFVLDHNYSEGSLSYTATYDKAQTIARDTGYVNISIVRNDPIEMIQEFVVPGRASGPIIQKLNMKTSRTISINIDGATQQNKTCSSISDLCIYLPDHSVALSGLLSARPDLIMTREEYTSNPIDGSFSISLEYTSKT